MTKFCERRISELVEHLAIAKEQAGIEKFMTQEAKRFPVEDQTRNMSYIDSKNRSLVMNIILPAHSPFSLFGVKFSMPHGPSKLHCRFMNQFENFTESKIFGPKQSQLYLTHCFRGCARKTTNDVPFWRLSIDLLGLRNY